MVESKFRDTCFQTNIQYSRQKFMAIDMVHYFVIMTINEWFSSKIIMIMVNLFAQKWTMNQYSCDTSNLFKYQTRLVNMFLIFSSQFLIIQKYSALTNNFYCRSKNCKNVQYLLTRSLGKNLAARCKAQHIEFSRAFYHQLWPIFALGIFILSFSFLPRNKANY